MEYLWRKIYSNIFRRFTKINECSEEKIEKKNHAYPIRAFTIFFHPIPNLYVIGLENGNAIKPHYEN